MSDLSIKKPDRIQTAVDIIEKAGFKAFVVGGCVRDSLLGRAPKDWDITTSAVPSQLKRIFEGYTQVETGLKHGTIMVVIDHEIVEITTFRIDGEYSDGRHPDKVSFTSDIVEDLSRRDFTMNACAVGKSEIIDPFGGQKDLKNKVIRCVGNPKKRFTEDALRILRAVRFSSELGFQIEEKTKEAMLQCRDQLSHVSQERITSEFCKTLMGENIRNTLSEFRDILVFVLPEIKDSIGFQQHNPYHIYDVFEHTLKSVEAVDHDLILKVTMLFHDIAKPQCFTLDESGIGHFYGHPQKSAIMAKHILQRMRFSSANVDTITQLIDNHDVKMKAEISSVKRFLNKLGEKQFGRLLKVKEADIMAQNPQMRLENMTYLKSIEVIFHQVLLQNSCFTLKNLAINGDDLLNIGVSEGRQVGLVLNKLLNMVIDEKLANNKEILIKKAITLL